MKQRLEWLDAVKGFGIILMILAHTIGLWYFGIFLMRGYVSMWFVLTGYNIFTLEDRGGQYVDILEFVKLKAKRLLIPYFIYGIFFIVFLYIVGAHNDILIRFYGLLYSRFSMNLDATSATSLILLNENSPMWFLTCMFLSCVWYALYYNTKIKGYGNFAFIVIVFLSLLLHHSPYLLPWSLDTSFVAALLIIIGTIIKEKRLQNTQSWYVVAISMLIYLVIGYLSGADNISIALWGKYGDICLFSVLLCGTLWALIAGWILQKCHRIITRPLSLFGKHSLRLLCFHYPIAVALRLLVMNLNLPVNKFIIAFLTITISLSISIGLSKLFSKYKIIYL